MSEFPAHEQAERELLEPEGPFAIAEEDVLGVPTRVFRERHRSLRQMLDLYACVRPVRHFKGVPSPVKAAAKVDMVVFRENTEGSYVGCGRSVG